MITARVPGNFGLGDGIGPGTLNCPGDPGCPGNPNTTVLNYPGMPGYLPAPSASGLTAWLAANPNAVWWGVGILALLAFASEGRR